MTRKDYRIIAHALYVVYSDVINTDLDGIDVFSEVVMRIGVALKADNPSFDYNKFAAACQGK